MAEVTPQKADGKRQIGGRVSVVRLARDDDGDPPALGVEVAADHRFASFYRVAGLLQPREELLAQAPRKGQRGGTSAARIVSIRRLRPFDAAAVRLEQAVVQELAHLLRCCVPIPPHLNSYSSYAVGVLKNSCARRGCVYDNPMNAPRCTEFD